MYKEEKKKDNDSLSISLWSVCLGLVCTLFSSSFGCQCAMCAMCIERVSSKRNVYLFIGVDWLCWSSMRKWSQQMCKNPERINTKKIQPTCWHKPTKLLPFFPINANSLHYYFTTSPVWSLISNCMCEFSPSDYYIITIWSNAMQFCQHFGFGFSYRCYLHTCLAQHNTQPNPIQSKI